MAKKVKKAKSAKKKTKKKKSKQALKIPKGFKRPRAILGPQTSLADPAMGGSKAAPDHICVPTGGTNDPCLRYRLDPNTGQYSIPPFGELMDCATCRGG